MKKQLLLLIAFCISLQVLHAQTLDFQFNITNPSSDSTCDGQINLTYTGSQEPLNVIWYDNSLQPIGTSNNISGLCSGSNSVSLEDSHCQGYWFSTDLGDSSSSGSTFQLNLSLTKGNNSEFSSIEIQQYTGFSSAQYIDFGFNGFDSATTLYSDTVYTVSNITIDSLGSEYNPNYDPIFFYILYIWNSDYTNFIEFSFNNPGDSNSCNDSSFPLYASAQGTPVSDSSACDGYAFTEVYGGTPPFTYQYSSGSISDTASGLCPGSYIVTVTDADSNVFNTSFVISYPSTYYFFDDGNYTYLDTLYSNALQDCGINYTLPIDSFYIDSSYSISNWEYVVYWTIVQDSNQFAFTETYFIDSTGYYYFGLSLYCDARSSSFGSYTFFSGAYADMSTISTQIETIANDEFISVYPNPSNGIFTITSSKNITSYSIFDALGRKVLTKTTNLTTQSIDIQALNTGMYYLMVQFEDGSIGKQKLIKK